MIKQKEKNQDNWLSYNSYRKITQPPAMITAPCGYLGTKEPCCSCPVKSCKYNFGDWLSEHKAADAIIRKQIENAREAVSLGSYTDALEILSKNDNGPLSMCAAGTVNALMGDIDTAINKFESVMSIYPDYQGGWNGMAIMKYISGEYDTAREYFEAGIKGTENSFVLKCNTGFLEICSGNLEDAEKYFSEVIESNDENSGPTALYGMGLIYSIRKDQVKAKESFMKALELRPGDSIIKNAIKELL